MKYYKYLIFFLLSCSVSYGGYQERLDFICGDLGDNFKKRKVSICSADIDSINSKFSEFNTDISEILSKDYGEGVFSFDGEKSISQLCRKGLEGLEGKVIYLKGVHETIPAKCFCKNKRSTRKKRRNAFCENVKNIDSKKNVSLIFSKEFGVMNELLEQALERNQHLSEGEFCPNFNIDDELCKRASPRIKELLSLGQSVKMSGSGFGLGNLSESENAIFQLRSQLKLRSKSKRAKLVIGSSFYRSVSGSDPDLIQEMRKYNNLSLNRINELRSSRGKSRIDPVGVLNKMGKIGLSRYLSSIAGVDVVKARSNFCMVSEDDVKKVKELKRAMFLNESLSSLMCKNNGFSIEKRRVMSEGLFDLIDNIGLDNDLVNKLDKQVKEKEVENCTVLSKVVDRMCSKALMTNEEFMERNFNNSNFFSLSNVQKDDDRRMVKDLVRSLKMRSCLKQNPSVDSDLESIYSLDETEFDELLEAYTVSALVRNKSIDHDIKIPVEVARLNEEFANEQLPDLVKQLNDAKSFKSTKFNAQKKQLVKAIEKTIQGRVPFPVDFQNFSLPLMQMKLKKHNEDSFNKSLSDYMDALVNKRKELMGGDVSNSSLVSSIQEIDKKIKGLSKKVAIPDLKNYPFKASGSKFKNKSVSENNTESTFVSSPGRRQSRSSGQERFLPSSGITPGQALDTQGHVSEYKSENESVTEEQGLPRSSGVSPSRGSSSKGPASSGLSGGSASSTRAPSSAGRAPSSSDSVSIYEYDNQKKALIICNSLEEAKTATKKSKYKEVYVFADNKLMKVKAESVEKSYTIKEIRNGDVDKDVREELVRLYPDKFKFTTDDLSGELDWIIN